MPDPQTTDTVVVETPTSETTVGTPQSQERANIYARYYEQTQPSTTTVQDPVATPSVDANVEVSGQEQVQDPTANVEPTNEPAPQANETLELIRSLQNEIQSLKQQIPTAQPTQTVAQPVEDVDAVEQFLTLLQAGKAKEAVAVLKESVREEVVRDVQTKFIPEAESRAVDRVNTNAEIDKFINTLRVENPELMPMEELIGVKAQARLEAAGNAGKIKNNADFVREYKAAVTAAVDDTRKLYQQIRGAGKQEALTTKQTVVNALPVPPNPVSTPQGETTQPVETLSPYEKYMAERKARSWQSRGIS